MCKIGVVDSGVGGISTLCALMKLLPNEQYVYVADRSGCPYGERTDAYIMGRLRRICHFFAGLGTKVIVLACNTATNVCISRLRQEMPSILFVGVEPAVRPAAEELTCGKALVLVTPAAARQTKFLSLVRGVERTISFRTEKPVEKPTVCDDRSIFCAENISINSYRSTNCTENIVTNTYKSAFCTDAKLIICPQPRLASIIEKGIDNLSAIREQVEKELSPFKSQEIESVVLGCTHYCLVADLIGNIFSAKVYDGNIGTAIRLHSLLKARGLISRKSNGFARFVKF